MIWGISCLHFCKKSADHNEGNTCSEVPIQSALCRGHSKRYQSSLSDVDGWNSTQTYKNSTCCPNYSQRVLIQILVDKGFCFFGQCCGSVGRAVASDTRGPQFKSSHRQKFINIEHLYTVNCVLKRRK